MDRRRRGGFLAIGLGAGIAIGVGMRNIAVGAALGLAFGLLLMRLAERREGR
ncbi:hypothetical protein GCM10008101_15690 [Lysobacter xinjiangensis]|uniref:Glycine zipper family protein n=1 Tax=Cognatilysobacter xinjiangensis TaxID=546892 RepID=A0ABQ3C000_9GAMM|nr:hypothetical protein [Lysobacter xinjiangensis]GGZ62399.1 hypothetical protein GCM10008101_15690 [Lysobacter xinjiangensis]